METYSQLIGSVMYNNHTIGPTKSLNWPKICREKLLLITYQHWFAYITYMDYFKVLWCLCFPSCKNQISCIPKHCNYEEGTTHMSIDLSPKNNFMNMLIIYYSLAKLFLFIQKLWNNWSTGHHVRSTILSIARLLCTHTICSQWWLIEIFCITLLGNDNQL